MKQRNGQPDFFEQLNEQMLEQLEALARKPGTTGAKILAWLTEIGVKTSGSAVDRWLMNFRIKSQNDEAVEAVKTYIDAAGDLDPTAVTQASLKKFQEVLFTTLVDSDGGWSPKALMNIANAMKAGLNAQQLVNDIKSKFDAAMSKLSGKKTGITQADIDDAGAMIFGGAYKPKQATPQPAKPELAKAKVSQ